MEGGDFTYRASHLVLQLAFILFVAKVFGELFQRYLKQPAVLGELTAGMLIGPYALGQFFKLPGMKEVWFPQSSDLLGIPANSIIPLPVELWAFAQLAAVILLFLAGLETDLGMFRRFGPRASLIAAAGVIFPFFFAQWLTVRFVPGVDSLMAPTALAMGAISTATSVGITARVLEEMNKLDMPESVTIIAAAVMDDVLGIIVIAVVGSMVAAQVSGTSISITNLATLALTSIGFWLLIVAGAILVAPFLARWMRRLHAPGAILVLSLACCFLVAGLMEQMHLAMIIGSYSMGLAFSRTEIADELHEVLEPVVHFTVPVFFVVMGMLVDFPSMIPILKFGMVMTLFAIIAKVIGCGVAAFPVGFNKLGASRIGFGMLPRGEVALIVAGIAVSNHWINESLFGVAIMLTFVTTMIAPIVLVPLFRNPGSGLRERPMPPT